MMLFIKSDNKPVALAGVIGAKDSQINSGTKDVVLEFANFDAGTIRKTMAKIGTRTDAGTRFEKSLDTNLIHLAASRMIALLQQHDKAAVVSSAYCGVVNSMTMPIKLQIDKDYVEKFCGVKFDWDNVLLNMFRLGFQPNIINNDFCVTVPTWRSSKDVTCEADVIEEIIRTYGYDNVSPVAPRLDVVPVSQPPMKIFINKLKDQLAKMHYCKEVHTYLWSDTPSGLKVINSSVKGCDYIRDSLIPSILKIVDKNKANHEIIRIFEIGKVFDDGKEQCRLAICIPGYRQLAQILRELFGNVKFDTKSTCEALHPKNSATVYINGKEVGVIGIVAGKDCVVAEIVLDDICAEKEVTFKAPSKYQKNKLDFTFTHDGIYGDIENIFEKFSHELLMSFALKCIYKNKYTLQFMVGSYEKTLTAEDINDIWAKIIAHGRKNGLTLEE